jgi:hypothetical protein
MNKACWLLLVALVFPKAAVGDVINWVGYQFGPPGGLQGLPDSASFFHDDQWLGYVVPGEDDIAVFDITFDPQENQMPNHVYFGDYRVPRIPLYNPSETIVPGGDAIIDQLLVKRGQFTFHFTDQSGVPQGSLTSQHQLVIGEDSGAHAELRLVDASLTTRFVTHIASGDASAGILELDGGEWNHESYIDLGWVGDGRITLRQGATVDAAGSIFAGIRGQSQGTLEVLSGSNLTVHSGVAIGGGHESDALAKGKFTINGSGSQARLPDLFIGNAQSTGFGTVTVSNGGMLEVGNSVHIRNGSLTVSDGKLIIGGSLNVGPHGRVSISDNAIVNVGAGDPPEPGFVRIGPGGTLSGTGEIAGGLFVDGTVAELGSLTEARTIRVGRPSGAETMPSALTVGQIRSSSLLIGSTASVTLLNNSASSVLNQLDIEGTPDQPLGTFDLTNNTVIVDFDGDGESTVSAIRRQIVSGRGGPGLDGHWSGNGITSSTVAQDVLADPNSTSIGYAVNGQMPLGPMDNIGGQPIDLTSVLIRYTKTGDANLDGVVGDEDVTILGATYAPGVPQAQWALGDFDYNGFVDDTDVTLLGVFYDPSAPPLAMSTTEMPVAAVPEPAAWALSAIGALIVVIQWVRRLASRRT